MSATEEEPFDPVLTTIESALASPKGREIVLKATAYLVMLLETNRFNSERAKEVYAIAVDNAVWAYLENMPIRRFMYKDYKASGLGAQLAAALTADFTQNGAIKDQRPVRKGFRWLLGA